MPIVNEGVLEEMKHIANPSELKHIQEFELYEKPTIYNSFISSKIKPVKSNHPAILDCVNFL